MNTVNFTNPRAQFFDNNGKLLAGGRVFYYEQGTQTLKDIYSDEAGTTLNNNPVILDGSGYVTPSTGVHLGEGYYDIRVQYATGATPIDPEDPDDLAWVDFWTYPDVKGGSATATGSILSKGYVNTIDQLKDLDPGEFDSVEVTGYYSHGDGGGRDMYWDADATEADNGGTIIAPNTATATGRWKWLNDSADSYVTPQLFGAFPSDGSLVVLSQLANLSSWANGNGLAAGESGHIVTVHFNKAGNYHLNGSLNFGGNINIVLESGVAFKNNTGSAVLTLIGFDIKILGRSKMVDVAPVAPSMQLQLVSGKPMDVYPEWWGVVNSTSVDSSYAMQKCTQGIVGAPVGSRIIIGGNFSLANYAVTFGHDLVFPADAGGLYLDGSSVSIIGQVFSHKKGNLTPIFFGTGLDLAQLYFTNLTEYHSCWFNSWFNRLGPYNMDTVFMNEFITRNTQSGNRYVRWIVDETRSVYNVNLGTIARYDRGNDYHLKFIWDFRNDIRLDWTTGGGTEMVVEAGDVQFFMHKATSTSTHSKVKLFGDVNPVWFGAEPGPDASKSNNVVAFEGALKTNLNSISPDNYFFEQVFTVDGKGKNFSINGTIEVGEINSDSLAPRLSNTGLYCSGTGTGTGWIYSAAGIILDNCMIESPSAGVPLLYPVNNTKHRIVEIRNSKIKSASNILYGAAYRCLIQNCDIEFVDSSSNAPNIVNFTTTEEFRIVNSQFHRAYSASTGVAAIELSNGCGSIEISGSSFKSVGLKTSATKSVRVENNIFDRCWTQHDYLINVHITGNTFITNDYVNARVNLRAVGSSTAYGLVVKNNVWRDGVSNPATAPDMAAINVLSGFNSGGHYAEITENYGNSSYILMAATKIKYDLAVSLTGGVNYNVNMANLHTGSRYLVFPLLTSRPVALSHSFVSSTDETTGITPVARFDNCIMPSTLDIGIGTLGASGSFLGSLIVELEVSSVSGRQIPSYTINPM